MAVDLTIALAGHATNTVENTTFLLSEWLDLGAPDEGYYAKPGRWGHITILWLLTDGEVPEGLAPALDLTAHIEDTSVHLITDRVTGPITRWARLADDVSEVEDPLDCLIRNLADARAATLFISWDEEDADDEKLINLAHAHKSIRVSDLVLGLSEILPGEDESETAPPSIQDDPPRRRRTDQDAPTELNEQPEELEAEAEAPTEVAPAAPSNAPPASTLEEEVAAAKRGITQSTIAMGDIKVSADYLRDLVHTVERAAFFMRAHDAQNAAKNLATDTKYSPLTEALCNSVESLNELLSPELAYEETVSKPTKPKGKAGKPVKVVWDADAQTWNRAGRGRTRAGVRVGWMDEDGHVTEAA